MVSMFFTRQKCRLTDSYSPSSAKPSLAVASWSDRFQINVIEPARATIDQLARGHKYFYLKDVLSCRAVNGIGNTSIEVAETPRYDCCDGRCY